MRPCHVSIYKHALVYYLSLTPAVFHPLRDLPVSVDYLGGLKVIHPSMEYLRRDCVSADLADLAD
jgi:hypothetical protein